MSIMKFINYLISISTLCFIGCVSETIISEPEGALIECFHNETLLYTGTTPRHYFSLDASFLYEATYKIRKKGYEPVTIKRPEESKRSIFVRLSPISSPPPTNIPTIATSTPTTTPMVTEIPISTSTPSLTPTPLSTTTPMVTETPISTSTPSLTTTSLPTSTTTPTATPTPTITLKLILDCGRFELSPQVILNTLRKVTLWLARYYSPQYKTTILLYTNGSVIPAEETLFTKDIIYSREKIYSFSYYSSLRDKLCRQIVPESALQKVIIFTPGIRNEEDYNTPVTIPANEGIDFYVCTVNNDQGSSIMVEKMSQNFSNIGLQHKHFNPSPVINDLNKEQVLENLYTEVQNWITNEVLSH